MLKNSPVIQEIQKIKKDFKKTKQKILKDYPNLIDRYALSDKTIEEQEKLFNRNIKKFMSHHVDE